MHIEDFQPINADILIRLKKESEVMGSTIVYGENTDKKENQFFTVLATGPDVKELAVGDVVIVPWARVTPPFKASLGGKLITVGITSEKEVLGVVEQ